MRFKVLASKILIRKTQLVFHHFTVREEYHKRFVRMVSEKKYLRIVHVVANLIVMLSWSSNCAGKVVQIGGGSLGDGTFNWYPRSNTSFYQDWADKQFVYDNDTFWFVFNNTLHNVVAVQTPGEFDNCQNSSDALYYSNNASTQLNPSYQLPVNRNQTWYVFSNINIFSNRNSSDCPNGMKFSIVLHGSAAQNPSAAQDPSGSGKKKVSTAVIVSIALVCGFVLIGAASGFTLYRNRHKHKVDSRGTFGDQGSSAADWARRQEAFKGIMCTIFSLKELNRATNKFSNDNKLGSGGFGTVYKGTLDNGTIVAVKRTNNLGGNDKDQFLNEVSILSQVNSRDLVKLLGCCVELEVPLLVFEFIPNGTLQEHLVHAGEAYSTKLDWTTRFRIAIQTAEALKYLHFQARPPIFHRDVKSANILLDDNFDAKVADFGLSKLVDLGATHVSTMVKGTPGYLDPEYYHNFQLTDKTDVYSFGMVLLELITAKKPVDLSRDPGLQNLAMASVPMIRTGRTREIVDQTLISESFTEDNYAEVEGVGQIAAACLGTDRASRPSMKEVVDMLQNLHQSGTAPTALNYLAKTPSYGTGIEMQNGYNFLLSQSSIGNSDQATSSSTDQPQSPALISFTDPR